MEALFFTIFGALILTELIKGLSANGTPPVLQRFSWQIDLAYFMWSHIVRFRIALVIALVFIAAQLESQDSLGFFVGFVLCAALWGGIYWLFNKFWVGRVKFLPITQKVFVGAKDNQVDLSLPVIGVTLGGETKAYPANMLFYHHVLSDVVGGQAILATYCGMCRSGRVYDIDWPEGVPDFMLVGAISFNAILRDSLTHTWWRQETGEAAKGARKGDQLDDIYFEQMSLANWLEKHPDSLVLQYDPVFAGKYNFLGKLLKFEASFPRWHLQKTPPLVVGIEVEGAAKAYDVIELQKRRLVNDEVNGASVLVMGDEARSSTFVYDRTVEGQILTFAVTEAGIIDEQTGSQWSPLGLCKDGQLKGKSLKQLQSYQQFIRAWITFHPDTDFYQF